MAQALAGTEPTTTARRADRKDSIYQKPEASEPAAVATTELVAAIT